MQLNGKTIHPKSVRQAIDLGIAYVPEDRLTEGLFLTQSIERNIIVTSLDKMVSGLFINRKKVDQVAKEMFDAMQIAAPGPHTPVNHLSGGNAQRVVLARWLLTGAKVLKPIKKGELITYDNAALPVGSRLAELRARQDKLVYGS